MSFTYGSDKKSAVQARYDAQKIAFAPIMFQAAKALRDLGILDYLMKKKNKETDIGSIANNLNLSNYGVKVLLEAGLSLEMVMVEDEQWALTKTGYFILRDDLTKVNMDFTNDVNYLGFFHLQDAIKNGKPEGLKVLGNWDTVYEGLAELPENIRKSWFAFDHYYSDYAKMKEDLDIESLDFVDIAVIIEKQFGLKVTSEQMVKIKKLEDLYNFILERSKN